MRRRRSDKSCRRGPRATSNLERAFHSRADLKVGTTRVVIVAVVVLAFRPAPSLHPSGYRCFVGDKSDKRRRAADHEMEQVVGHVVVHDAKKHARTVRCNKSKNTNQQIDHPEGLTEETRPSHECRRQAGDARYDMDQVVRCIHRENPEEQTAAWIHDIAEYADQQHYYAEHECERFCHVTSSRVQLAGSASASRTLRSRFIVEKGFISSSY